MRERHYDRMFFFSHLTSNSTQIMTIHEISKMQLLNYLKYLLFFFCITAVASTVYDIS